MTVDIETKQAWKKRRSLEDIEPWTEKEYKLLYSAVSVFVMVVVLFCIFIFAVLRGLFNV